MTSTTTRILFTSLTLIALAGVARSSLEQGAMIKSFSQQVKLFLAADTQQFCWKKAYGRGVGTIPKQCASNMELDAGLCYKKCATDYKGVGPVCWQKCKTGFSDHGLSCYKSIVNFYFKKSSGRGVGVVPRSCGSGKNYDAGLCYTPCRVSFNGIGPVCWGKCTGNVPFDCGAACASSSQACLSNVLEQIFSIFSVVEKMFDFLGGIEVPDGESLSTELAMKALYGAAKDAINEEGSKEAFTELIQGYARKMGIPLPQRTIEDIYEKAQESGSDEFDWKEFSKMDPTGITDVVSAFMHKIC